MSELSEAFKKSIVAFMTADDFIVSLYEGAYMMAEDISDKMADERKLYQASLEERFTIENEIGGAVAFFGKLLPAFLVMQISLLEDCLLEIDDAAASEANVTLDVGRSDDFKIEDAKSFFQERLGVNFPDPWPSWDRVLEFQELRNAVVNHAGLQAGHISISDSFLVDINKTIVTFLEELEKYVSNSRSGAFGP